jgi:hypothetical protein
MTKSSDYFFLAKWQKVYIIFSCQMAKSLDYVFSYQTTENLQIVSSKLKLAKN